MNKRILSGLAALALTFSGAGTALMNATNLHFELAASAAAVVKSGTCGEDVTWTLDDEGTLTISGTGAMRSYYTYGSSPWYYNKSIKKVVIKNGVTSIGDSAFHKCTSLSSITIPDSVTSISNYAFDECTSLSSITIPDSVTSIGNSAFCGCKSLKSITIPNSITSIGSSTFSGCTSLSSITIPDSVTSIGNYAFIYCTNLSSITIPNSVTSIGDNAFGACSGLTSITIPDSVTNIGDGAFYYCTSLSSITIPNSVTSINDYAFSGCTSLSSITIPDSVTDIGEFAFSNSGLTSITIPNSVTSIGNAAFYDCTSLSSITIPKSVTNIGDSALGYCNGDNYKKTKIDDFKIYCYQGTAGEQYAIDNGFDYELIKSNPVIKATPGEGTAKLEWKSIPNAENYAVYVNVGGDWKYVKELSDNSYVLKGLKEGTDYEVVVIAKFDGEWNTDFSNAITVTPKAAAPSRYPTVTNTEYSEEFHQFRLTWNAVEGATQYGVAVKLGGKWKVQTYTEKTYFTSPKLRPGSVAEMVICAKVNGKWDTSNINGRAFKVTVK